MQDFIQEKRLFMDSDATKCREISDDRNGPFPQADREISEHLRQLAQEVFSDISELDPSRSKELLGVFVSELFLSVSEQERRTLRRQQQLEGIEAAKQRGVRFGRARKPLPENFDECRLRWRNGELTMYEAAEACGMPHSSFYAAAVRIENAG